MKSLVVGASCGLVAAVLGVGAVPAHAQFAGGGVTTGWRSDSLRPTDPWNTFTADVRVRRSHVRKNGTAIGALAPDAQYRIERSNRSGSWKTVLTVLSIERSSRVSLGGVLTPPGPLPVQRIELDENGTPMRAYNAQGAIVRSYKTGAPVEPSSSTPLRSIGIGWIDSLVATPVGKALRQQGYERRYGMPSIVGTQHVYKKQQGARRQQLFVDPVNMVTTEAHDQQNDVRIARTVFRYGSAGGAGLVRLGTRSEVLVSPAVDDVTVVDVAFTNIRLERR